MYTSSMCIIDAAVQYIRIIRYDVIRIWAAGGSKLFACGQCI